MSDIKIFTFSGSNVTELLGKSVAVEKSLQKMIEANLSTFLGVTFLQSEYSTGKTHGGRIDTLGIDENGCPVIVEYKRSLNENVINQGLFYLDWLLDHKAEFELIVLRQLGKEVSDGIEWDGPRLLCIAGDFTKYDEYAVQQINRNIELIRYKQYGDKLLLFELVNAGVAEIQGPKASAKPVAEVTPKQSIYKSFESYYDEAEDEVKDRFEALKAYCIALGGDVQFKPLLHYVAFRRLKNFACANIRNRENIISVWVKLDPSAVKLEEGFTRDVTDIGHWGTGNLEITIRNDDDFDRAKSLIAKSYDAS